MFHDIEDIKEFDVINTKPHRYHVISKNGSLVCVSIFPFSTDIECSIQSVLKMGGFVIGNSKENPALLMKN